MFVESFDTTVLHYRRGVAKVASGNLQFANTDWDTGNKTMKDEYSLADKTYSDWVIKLKEKKFETMSASAKRNILDFYKNQVADPSINAGQWQQTLAALEEIKMEK